MAPVDIVQAERNDLPRSNAIRDEEGEDGPIAQTGGRLQIRDAKEAAHGRPGQRTRETFERVEVRQGHAGREIAIEDAFPEEVPQEGTDDRADRTHRLPRIGVACPNQESVDVPRGQVAEAPGGTVAPEVIKELAQEEAIQGDRRLAEAAIDLQRSVEGRDGGWLVNLWRLPMAIPFEIAEKSPEKPSRRADLVCGCTLPAELLFCTPPPLAPKELRERVWTDICNVPDSLGGDEFTEVPHQRQMVKAQRLGMPVSLEVGEVLLDE